MIDLLFTLSIQSNATPAESAHRIEKEMGYGSCYFLVSPVLNVGVNLRGILRCAHFEVSAAGFDPAEVEVVLRPCLS